MSCGIFEKEGKSRRFHMVSLLTMQCVAEFICVPVLTNCLADATVFSLCGTVYSMMLTFRLVTKLLTAYAVLYFMN